MVVSQQNRLLSSRSLGFNGAKCRLWVRYLTLYWPCRGGSGDCALVESRTTGTTWSFLGSSDSTGCTLKIPDGSFNCEDTSHDKPTAGCSSLPERFDHRNLFSMKGTSAEAIYYSRNSSQNRIPHKFASESWCGALGSFGAPFWKQSESAAPFWSTSRCGVVVPRICFSGTPKGIFYTYSLREAAIIAQLTKCYYLCTPHCPLPTKQYRWVRHRKGTEIL